MSDIHLNGNYMSLLFSFFASHAKQPENLQNNLGKTFHHFLGFLQNWTNVSLNWLAVPMYTASD